MEELKELISQIYGEVLDTTNKALRLCKYFTIEMLQQEDPSYDQIAEQLGEAAALIDAVAEVVGNDPECVHMAGKALEYALAVKHIAKAISKGDEATLKKLVSELDRRPFV